MSISTATQEMQRVNEAQRAYYDSLARRQPAPCIQEPLFWRAARSSARSFRKTLAIDQYILDTELSWLGELRDRKVLELGCFDGSRLSLAIAEQAGEYVGIDLSPVAVARFQGRLERSAATNARARCADILDPNFMEAGFDIVYAHGVLHHFRYLDATLRILHAKLADGGRIVSFDPLNTSTPIVAARRLYRPRQRDAAWEWPLTRKSFQHIERYFDIADVRGMLGLAKWVVPLSLIPGCQRLAASVGRHLHHRDVAAAREANAALWRCMSVLLHLKKRSANLD